METLALSNVVARGAQPDVAPAVRRHDMYVGIHKALRALMCDVLVRVGRMDANDPDDVREVLAHVRELLAVCTSHLEHENDFVHTAMEARRPDSSAQTAEDHAHHEIAIDLIEADLQAVERADGPGRADAALRLYRRLALFVAENLQHMHVEETENNAALWAAYDDAELVAIEKAIVASLPPEESLAVMRWMIPAIAPVERAHMLSVMQREAPPEALAAVLMAAKPHLSEREWLKLMGALAPFAG